MPEYEAGIGENPGPSMGRQMLGGVSGNLAKPDPSDNRRKIVGEWHQKIRAARDKHHADAFKRMAAARQWATYGCDASWLSSKNYRVNMIGRHITQKSAELYATNPTVDAKPGKRIDFRVWDGTTQSLMMAQQQTAEAAAVGMMPSPEAMEVMMDYQEGMAAQSARKSFANTVQHFVQSTWDKDFKLRLKQAVRVALTEGVAYVRFDLFRTMTRAPDVLAKITDTRTRLAHLESALASATEAGEAGEDRESEIESLQNSLNILQGEQEFVEQEGVIYTFPKPNAMIVDPDCTDIRTFDGAGWLAQERYMTPLKARESYGVDVSAEFSGYSANSKGSMTKDLQGNSDRNVCVWEVFDRDTQEVFVIADGYPDFLEEPASPKVYREGFFPVIPIVFNEGDLPEGELYPQSDVMLLMEIQDEHNQSKQGLRLHRVANRPIYVAPLSAFTDENEIRKITDLETHGIAFLKALQPGAKVRDLFQPLEKAPIDPSLYDTSAIMSDFQIIGGFQEANIGPVSGATATESSIAENSRSKSTSEDADSLDEALSALAEEVAKMSIDGMSEEFVVRAVGRGAVWPAIDRQSLAQDLEIKVKAGSSGKPNKAAEAATIERVTPLLLQLPGINPRWVADRILSMLDDGVDTAEAMQPDLPSITAQNSIAGQSPEPEATGGNAGGQPAYGDSGNNSGEVQ